ncbi:BTAD domain-containing putative transcriptional regulator [Asanoa sp. NPDC049518]|uniref:AfsR/SARP family transcriptional regulator n=1 Tax=unclassified Asanoa TaxID=2685164 RepID=UPI00343373EF
MTVRFRVLGNVEVCVDGALVDIGHLRQQCVLVALLVEPDGVVPIDKLVDRVWADRPPQRAVGTLRSYLSRLRGVLAAAANVDIARRPGGYVLTVDPMAVDMHRFRRLVAQARAAGGDTGVALFEEALGLWRGEPFATLDTPWLNSERDALKRQRLEAELDRNDLALSRGEHTRLLDELSVRAAAHPLDERLAGQLMLALYRCGRQADALGAYRQVRLTLAEELGADPSPPLAHLHQRLLAGDPALIQPVVPAAASDSRLVAQVPRQLPAPPRSFVGRVRELAALGAVLEAQPDAGGTVAISAIGGAAGVGKTWLALRWAHDNLHRFPDGQLYVNLGGFDPDREVVDPAVALRGFLDALGVPSTRIPADPDAQAALYRSLVADRRMLIVLDNARDSTHVLRLLPGSGACTVLVTSRHHLAGLLAAHGARPLALDVLPDGDARMVLTEQLGTPRVADEPDAVTAILDSCAGLPLALGIVAARAAIHVDLSLATLAGELRDASTRLDALDAGELAVNVRAVLDCSYQALPAAAARALRLLALAPGPDISLPAAASLVALTVAGTRTVLRQLITRHLLQENSPGRYRMHDLVRLYTAEQAHVVETAEERRAAIQRALDHYLHTAHAAALLLNPHRVLVITPDPAEDGVAPEGLADLEQSMAWLTDEQPVLLAAIDQASDNGFDTHTWQLAWSLANFLERRGDWHTQVATQRAALDATLRLAHRKGQAIAHRGLAIASSRMGEYEAAHTHLRHALSLFCDLGDHAGQAHTRINIGWLLGRQGLFDEALSNALRALDLYVHAEDRSGQASALNNIGWYHAQLGDYERTLDCCRQAVAVYRELDNHFGEAEAWDSLGYAHHHLGRHEEAVTCFQKALDLFRGLGGRHAEAEVLTHLGDCQHAAGDLEAARHAWRRALRILDQLDHPGADQIRVRLGR